MEGFKTLTEDNFSPIQLSNKPVLPVGFKLPYTLPPVKLDTTQAKCGSGWNFCASVKEAMNIAKIVGFYGINNFYKVTGGPDSLIRGNKIRSSTLQIDRKITIDELWEPNSKQKELFEWLFLEQKEESEEIITKCLFETLRIKSLDWKDVKFFKLNSHYYSHYTHYYSHYNDYNHYYSYYTHYYSHYNDYNYIVESLFEPNPQFRQALIKAYQHGMRQIRFDNTNKRLIIATKSNLPK